MGLNLKRDMRRNVPIDLTREETSYYMKYFRQIDRANKGFCSLADLRRYLQVNPPGSRVRAATNTSLVGEQRNHRRRTANTNAWDRSESKWNYRNRRIPASKECWFCSRKSTMLWQLMSAIKSGTVAASHFAKAAGIEQIKSNPPPERSGGGV